MMQCPDVIARDGKTTLECEQKHYQEHGRESPPPDHLFYEKKKIPLRKDLKYQ